MPFCFQRRNWRDPYADDEGLLANVKLNNADMLVDDFDSYNNDRQDAEDVAIINPEDTVAEQSDPLLATDRKFFRDK